MAEQKGDLTWRKLAPALYNLLLDQQLPEPFAVIGLDIKEGSVDFPNYKSGTWGPKVAEASIAKDGRSWLQPTALAPQLRELVTNRLNGNRWPIPQLGEINIPRPMDAAEGHSLYDGFMAGVLAWTNKVSEC
jgi:hypothetical protein